MIPFARRPKRPRESPYKAHPRLGPYPSYPPFASLREGARTARLLAPGPRLRERTRRLRIFLNCPLPPARPRSEHLVVAEGKVVDAGQTPQTVTYVPGLFRYRCRRLHNELFFPAIIAMLQDCGHGIHTELVPSVAGGAGLAHLSSIRIFSQVLRPERVVPPRLRKRLTVAGRRLAGVGSPAHVAVLRNPLRPWEVGLRFHGTGCGGSTTGCLALHQEAAAVATRAGKRTRYVWHRGGGRAAVSGRSTFGT